MPRKLKYHWSKSFLCVVIVVSVCFSTFLPGAEAQQGVDSNLLRYEVNSAFSGQLTHTIQVENPTFKRIQDGTLFVPLLKNETAHNYVIVYNITATTSQAKTLNDDSGNMYVYWNNLVIDPGEKFAVRIDYYVFSFGISCLINPEVTADYDRGSDLYERYTQPEQLVESDAPEIVASARSITEGTSNIHDKVFKIYSFVTSHLHYSRQEYERGAVWALENGTGDCSEYSYLFVALCRATGIPARIQTGFGFRSSDTKIVDGHIWAEYYLQNYGWVPVDPTWNMFDKIDEKHFCSMKSAAEITPYANYFFNYTEGPDESLIKHSQEILLTPSSINLFGNELVDDALKAVRTINHARFAVSLERILMMPSVFPSEAKAADQALQAGQINIQNALEVWQEDLQTAWSYILNAQRAGDEALQKGWLLVGYAFAILIAVLIVVLLTTSYFIRRRHRIELEKSLSQAESTGSATHIDRHSLKYSPKQCSSSPSRNSGEE